jgi:hypothetical protein
MLNCEGRGRRRSDQVYIQIKIIHLITVDRVRIFIIKLNSEDLSTKFYNLNFVLIDVAIYKA